MKSKWIVGLIALSSVSSQAQAMRSDIKSVCVSRDEQAQTLKVEARTRCLSSGTRTDSNSLDLSVDQNTATISITGNFETSYPNRIGSADCMGSRTITLESEPVASRRYALTFGDRFLGTVDYTAEDGGRQCYQVNRQFGAYIRERDFSDWTVGGVSGWAEWRAADLSALVAPLADRFPMTMEGRPEIELTMRKARWLPSTVFKPVPVNGQSEDIIAIRITLHGFLDDSVSGERFVALAKREPDGWRLSRLYSQAMCGRGETAGQWSSVSCP